MSARKFENTPLGLCSTSTQCLTVPSSSVRIRKNGIEFRNEQPFAPWTEMTVTLQGTGLAKKVNFTGVIVACTGNKHAGYHISMLFTGMSPQARERLGAMARSPFGTI